MIVPNSDTNSGDVLKRMQPIFHEIVDERAYQQGRWGDDFDAKNTPNDWISYVCRYATAAGPMPWDASTFRTKMLKAAALCIAAIEWCDRLGGNMPKRHYD
jgi:hypothetical protein